MDAVHWTMPWPEGQPLFREKVNRLLGEAEQRGIVHKVSHGSSRSFVLLVVS